MLRFRGNEEKKKKVGHGGADLGQAAGFPEDVKGSLVKVLQNACMHKPARLTARPQHPG